MDLYDRDLAGARFRRLCGGNQQEEDMESCIELAPIPGASPCVTARTRMPGLSGSPVPSFARPA